MISETELIELCEKYNKYSNNIIHWSHSNGKLVITHTDESLTNAWNSLTDEEKEKIIAIHIEAIEKRINNN